MQISFLAHCSGPQCAPQVCCAQLSRTVLAHNVRRKFAAHSCGALYWHTMCAARMQRTVVAHYSGIQCAAHSCRTLFLCATTLRRTVAVHFAVLPPSPLTPPYPPPPPLVYHPHCHIFFSSLPPGGVRKNAGMVGVLQKIKIWGWGWQFLTRGGGMGWFDIAIAKKN